MSEPISQTINGRQSFLAILKKALTRLISPGNLTLVLEFAAISLLITFGVNLFTSQWETKHQVEQKKVLFNFTGLIQAEKLQISTKSPELTAGEQDTSSFPLGAWSESKHLLISKTVNDSFVTWDIPTTDPGQYQLTVFLTKANDYGMVQFSIGNEHMGPPIDLWSGSGILSTGPMDLGLVKSKAGFQLTMKVIGRNLANKPPSYQAGIDGIRLTKVAPL